MDPRLLFYPNLVLCVAVLFELLFRFRKNSLLKVCFLLIIISLFAMNYFACTGVTTRFHVIVVKSMRLVYVCSTMLAIIHLVSPKIPRWFIGLIVFSVSIVIGIRILYYDQIDIERLSHLPNQVFTVGRELYTPQPVVRYTILGLAMVAIVIAFYYYRLFLMRINRESPHYKHVTRWIISFVVPFFLLAIFGILGNLGLLSQDSSSYLFSFFSCAIIFSILLRPGFLNTRSYSEVSRDLLTI
jgi:glucan phosphoethanolaminetransferase (alkaline phosphatase superfamily)